MMRIKEAIQRKKLIQEMNVEWRDMEIDIGSNLNVNQPMRSPSPMTRGSNLTGVMDRANLLSESDAQQMRLHNFVLYLSGKLTDLQKRALKITWRRLSEAPKTSGRGTLHIMEKVLTKLCEQSPGVTAIFYKSAFLSCIEDRKCGRMQQRSIATIRDHAHILIKLIDDILHIMFEGPLKEVKYDPITIGEAHSRLGPLGFDRSIWHVFGECFAEVMFMQECIRAYPHAPSAWSLLAVALTDKIFSASKMQNPRHSSSSKSENSNSTESTSTPPVSKRKYGMKCPFAGTHKRSLPIIGATSEDPMGSLDHALTSNEDDEVFYTARSQFENLQTLPTISHRKLPTLLTTSMCDESSFVELQQNPNLRLEDPENQSNRRCRISSNNKFLRSKSETRLKVRRSLRIEDESINI